MMRVSGVSHMCRQRIVHGLYGVRRGGICRGIATGGVNELHGSFIVQVGGVQFVPWDSGLIVQGWDTARLVFLLFEYQIFF